MYKCMFPGFIRLQFSSSLLLRPFSRSSMLTGWLPLARAFAPPGGYAPLGSRFAIRTDKRLTQGTWAGGAVTCCIP